MRKTLHKLEEAWFAHLRLIDEPESQPTFARWWKIPVAYGINDDPVPNALAYEDHEANLGYLSFSFRLFGSLSALYLSLMSHPDFLPHIGDPSKELIKFTDLRELRITGWPNDAKRAIYALNLVVHAGGFLAWHEMQHLMRGHGAYFASLMSTDDKAGDFLELNVRHANAKRAGIRRLLEVDADVRGGKASFVNTIASPGAYLFGEDHDPNEIAEAWAIAIALAMLFFAAIDDEEDWRLRSHLPPIMRFDMISSHATASLEESKESLLANPLVSDRSKKWIANIGSGISQVFSRALREATKTWVGLDILHRKPYSGVVDVHDEREMIAHAQQLSTHASGPLDALLEPFKRRNR